MPETLGNRFQPCSLWSIPQCVVCVGAVHDFREQCERRIRREVVFLLGSPRRSTVSRDDRVPPTGTSKGTAPSFCASDITWRAGTKIKFGLGVYELLDDPGAGHSIHFNVLTRNPFHDS